MATRLLLVRHGQIGANLAKRWHGSTDSPLTRQGEEQARKVADHLALTRPGIAALFTSPLERARRTAEPIGRVFGLEARILPGLAEYGIGELEGTPFVELTTEHRFFERTHADLDWAPPGGESLRGVGARVLDAWRHMAATHPGRDVVAVSHGAAIAAGIALLLHQDVREWQRYHMRNTSVTELLFEPAPELVAFDRLDHLESRSR